MSEVVNPVIETPDGKFVQYVVMRAPEHINIHRDMPWAGWPEPTASAGILNKMRVHLESDGPDEEDLVLTLHSNGERVNVLSMAAIQQLGNFATFPAEFCGKLSRELAVLVVNERLERSNDREVTVLSHDGLITNLMPGTKELIPYANTAQFVYDQLTQVYGDVTVKQAYANGAMKCRFMTEVQRPITQKVGDILSLGVSVEQSYGGSTELQLYAERLSCLNGMTCNRNEFKWVNRSGNSKDEQFAWLRQGTHGVTDAFMALVNKSKLMAETRIEGDPEKVLIEHARAMNLPQRHHDALLLAFREEPGNTEWDLLNAFTRLGTHGGLVDLDSRRVQRSSGEWAESFDIVTARLPRPMATAVGAHIIDGPG